MSDRLPPVLHQLLRLAREPCPASSVASTPAEWDLLIRVGRSSNLLGAIADSLERGGGLHGVPEGPRIHLAGALTLARQQSISVRWEATKIAAAFGELSERVVLLKGAAYVAEGLPFAAGRMFSDVDVLVPETRIEALEQMLMRHGWATTHHTEYDQTYYRRWMHEIPPMRHLQRGTVIDVHHRILPRTARFAPDPSRMLARARPSRLWPGIHVLCREDMLLHSATHLYHEGELHNGWRDLLDIDRLVASFATEPGFWPALQRRAAELDLDVPLRVVLRQAARMLGTVVPGELRDSRGGWIDPMYDHVLRPMIPLCDRSGTGFARWMAYARAHALRMPPHLLAYHLGRKALRRWIDLDDEAAT